MKKLIALLLLISAAVTSQAQHSLKWGKPSKEEIQLKVCSFDSSANAVVLAATGDIKFINNFIYLEIYRKIKILSSKGLDYVTVEIPYTVKNNLDDIQNLKAQTINFENGIPVITQLSKDQIFTQTPEPGVEEKKFTFPNVKEGSIVEYKYTIVNQRFYFLKDWHFQNKIPTIYSELKAEIPRNLEYNVILSGKLLLDKYNGASPNGNTWSLNNIPGYEHEDFVYCYKDYINQIQFQLKSYLKFDFNRVNNQSVLQSWTELAIDVTDEYSKYLEKKGIARDLLNQIIDLKDSREDALKKIYQFVQAFKTTDYDLFPVQNISDLIRSRNGNSAEINLLLCLLLNEAGIPANPILISTKNHGKVTKQFPQMDQFNHVMAAIPGKDSSYAFLDAVSNSSNYHHLPPSHINYWGFIVDGARSRWLKMDYRTESKENYLINYNLEPGGVKISFSGKYSGYAAKEKRENKINKTVKEPVFSLENELIKKDSSSFLNLENEYEDYSENYYYSSSVRPAGKLFLNLNLFEQQNPFKQKERQFPVELEFPYSINNTINIKLSKGDTATVIPKNLTLVLQDEGIQYGKFIYKTAENNNNIKVFIKWEMSETIIPQNFYSFLKEFNNKVISKLNEPIVIERK
ncbi:MAG: DUF3857 domain-containing protein [Sporocytophaga sp.]|uniref:DUF3857 domain-containing protein n=1 Tax=Sporocytophaga sp. TaxID=2231183 RepID=UPI001B2307B1|nr:DUF3857 domain-containing protein [Sporocytophaga sp.]MBO9703358.1 DUF3857 domain-containing protein [Sporocytophaga sp.]